VIGRGEAGPSNLHGVGPERAFAALESAVSGAFRAAGRPRARVGAAYLGLSGAGRPHEQAIVREWAERFRLADCVTVGGDAELLLAAGTPSGWGIAVVAGTGSIALGRSADGCSARAGGWGPTLGDEGSGYALATAGLRAVARSADGRGPATAMTESFLRRFDVRSAQDLIPKLRHECWDRPALAALAPLVLEAAEAGDPAARAIVDAAADELAIAAASVARQLDLGGPVPLAFAGGLMLGSTSYQSLVLEALSKAGVMTEPVALVSEPAEGALRLAESTVNR
jgi:N-acetylglucosamine kinase-like BadF-type ATPase